MLAISKYLVCTTVHILYYHNDTDIHPYTIKERASFKMYSTDKRTSNYHYGSVCLCTDGRWGRGIMLGWIGYCVRLNKGQFSATAL
jgi:hypothetical protein